MVLYAMAEIGAIPRRRNGAYYAKIGRIILEITE